MTREREKREAEARRRYDRQLRIEACAAIATAFACVLGIASLLRACA